MYNFSALTESHRKKPRHFQFGMKPNSATYWLLAYTYYSSTKALDTEREANPVLCA